MQWISPQAIGRSSTWFPLAYLIVVAANWFAQLAGSRSPIRLAGCNRPTGAIGLGNLHGAADSVCERREQAEAGEAAAADTDGAIDGVAPREAYMHAWRCGQVLGYEVA